MPILAVILLVTLALCVVAFRMGKRSDTLALALSMPLLIGAWKLTGVKIAHLDGAPSSVAIFYAGAWYLGLSCGLLAIAMFAGSYRARRSLVMAGLAVCAAATLTVRMAGRLTGRTPAIAGSINTPPSPSTPPRATYTEGYAWVVDGGIESDSACVNGTPEFIDGCRAAVRAH